MPYVIIAVIIVVLLVVVFLVQFVMNLIARLAFIVALPSLAGMRMIQSLGLTDPGWYVVLHALLGAAIGLWAHQISHLFQSVRRRLPGRAKPDAAPRSQSGVNSHANESQEGPASGPRQSSGAKEQFEP